MKKIRYWFLWLLGFFSLAAQAQYFAVEFSVDSLNYELLTEGGFRYAALTGGTVPYDGNLVIPKQVTCYGETVPVTVVSSSAFTNNKRLTSVDFGNVETISTGDWRYQVGAFSGCENLTSIRLHQVKSIGDCAFWGCSALTSVNFENVTSIGDCSFRHCTGLTSISMNQVEMIMNNAFNGCLLLKDVYSFGKQVPQLGVSDCFPTHFHLHVPYGMVDAFAASDWQRYYGSITEDAIKVDFKVDGFSYHIQSQDKASVMLLKCAADSISHLVIPKTVSFQGKEYSVDRIGSAAFQGFHMDSVDLGQVKQIGTAAFEGCKNLVSVDLQQVDSIGGYAFSDCSSLASLDLKQVKHIESYAFTKCSSLKSIDFNTLDSIGSHVFSNCSALTTINFNQLKTIGSYAFEGCSSLTSLKFDQVKKIHDYAFSHCDGLQNLEFFALEEIANHAFDRCKLINKVKVAQKKVPMVYDYSFSSRYRLFVFSGMKGSFESSYWKRSYGDIVQYDFEDQGYLYRISSVLDGTVSLMGYFREIPADFVVPEQVEYQNRTFQVTGLGPLLFADDDHLQSIDFKNVTDIGSRAFQYCDSLRNIDFKQVLTIGDDAFYGCSRLEAVDLQGVHTIKGRAFFDCLALKRMKINKTLAIGGIEYLGGDSRIVVYKPSGCFLSNQWTWGHVVTRVIDYDLVEDDVLYKFVADSTAVSYAGELQTLQDSVVIPERIQYHKGMWVREIESGAFESHTELKSIDFNGVRKIGASAFSGCNGLQNLDLKNVEYIGESAFKGITHLTSVKLHGYQPPVLFDISVFEHNACVDATLFVPAGSKDAYTQHTEWGNFLHIEEAADIATYDCHLTVISSAGGLVEMAGKRLVNDTLNTIIRKEEFVEIRFTPDTYQELAAVLVNGVDVMDKIGDCTYSLFATEDTEVKVTFQHADYLLDITSHEGGHVAVGDSVIQDETKSWKISGGEQVQLQVVPDQHYLVDSLLINGHNDPHRLVDQFYTFTMDMPKDIEVYFKLKQYELSLNVGKGGSLTMGDITLQQGSRKIKATATDSVTFQVTPAEHYLIDSVTVNGKNVTDLLEDNQYRLCVEGNTEVAVAFKLEEFPLTVTGHKNGWVRVNDHELSDSTMTLPIQWGDSVIVRVGTDIEFCVVDSVMVNGQNVTDQLVNDTYGFVMQEATHVEVSFKRGVFQLEVNANYGGKVLYDDQIVESEKVKEDYTAGEKVILLFEPYDGFDVKSVVLNGQEQSVDHHAYTFLMDQDMKFDILFERVEFSVDDAEDTYGDQEDVTLAEITYTRDFQDTEWQPLYVPFAMKVKDWQQNFEVAALNNVHQYDVDHDGTFDRTDLEVVRVTAGALLPNTPYVIRAKSTGSYTFYLEEVDLKAADSVAVDCSSLRHVYRFVGTYQGLSVEEIAAHHYYTVVNGELVSEPTAPLGAFRWYLSVSNRGSHEFKASRISIVEVDEVTGIETSLDEGRPFNIYSVDGRLVKADAVSTQGLPRGVYVVNGKKLMVK